MLYTERIFMISVGSSPQGLEGLGAEEGLDRLKNVWGCQPGEGTKVVVTEGCFALVKAAGKGPEGGGCPDRTGDGWIHLVEGITNAFLLNGDIVEVAEDILDPAKRFDERTEVVVGEKGGKEFGQVTDFLKIDPQFVKEGVGGLRGQGDAFGEDPAEAFCEQFAGDGLDRKKGVGTIFGRELAGFETFFPLVEQRIDFFGDKILDESAADTFALLAEGVEIAVEVVAEKFWNPLAVGLLFGKINIEVAEAVGPPTEIAEGRLEGFKIGGGVDSADEGKGGAGAANGNTEIVEKLDIDIFAHSFEVGPNGAETVPMDLAGGLAGTAEGVENKFDF